MPIAVIVYGPPGSGKGTQAELLARNFSFVHLDTGKYLRSFLWSKEAMKDKKLQKERELNQSGGLNTASFVLNIVKKRTQTVARAGADIVFSGSPRAYFEAFGDSNHEGLFHELERLYGKKNIFVVKIKISDEAAAARNKKRFICSVCGIPKLSWEKNKRCVFCAAPLLKRKDDAPAVTKQRIRAFEERTLPILKEIKKRHYKVIEINGEKLPYEVFASITSALKLK